MRRSFNEIKPLILCVSSSCCCVNAFRNALSLGEFLGIRRERRERGSEDKEPTSNAYNSEWRYQIFGAKYGPADSYFPLVHFFSHEYHSEYYRARINSVVSKSPYCMKLTKRWQKRTHSTLQKIYRFSVDTSEINIDK